MRYAKRKLLCASLMTALAITGYSLPSVAVASEAVGLYRVLEKSIRNDKPYANKFVDAELLCKFTAPSGKSTDFFGFYDGDGKGGGDKQTGNIWKLRFMPDELGEWHYVWRWSDGTEGGSGRFQCVEEGAGKGILKPYKKNPHWFAYNGSEPVWIKSYYETGHGSIAQPFDWITSHVYQPLIDRGYNHLQVNWLLSLCCFGQYYLDGPEPETQDLTLYEEGRATSTMRLDVWRRIEQHLGWLNDRNVGVHMFSRFRRSKKRRPKLGEAQRRRERLLRPLRRGPNCSLRQSRRLEFCLGRPRPSRVARARAGQAAGEA